MQPSISLHISPIQPSNTLVLGPFLHQLIAQGIQRPFQQLEAVLQSLGAPKLGPRGADLLVFKGESSSSLF